jgi:hypothetical protein
MVYIRYIISFCNMTYIYMRCMLELLSSMTPPSDPHGQAALILCESLILLLVEKGVIRREDAYDAVEGAIDVRREVASSSQSVVVTVASISLLQAVVRSIAAAAERPADGPEIPE